MRWPTESSEKWPKNLRPHNQRHIQVLNNHVDAGGERGRAREKTLRSCCYTYYLRREAWVESESEGGWEGWSGVHEPGPRVGDLLWTWCATSSASFG